MDIIKDNLGSERADALNTQIRNELQERDMIFTEDDLNLGN